MSMRLKSLLLLSVFALAALALAQGVSLKRQVKEGDTHSYRMSLSFSMWGEEALYTSVLTEKVIKVEPNGTYAVETTQTDYKAKFGEEEMTLSSEDLPKATRVLTPAGEIVQLQGDLTNEAAYRLSNLDVFRPSDMSVSTGDTWKVELKANADTGTKATTIDYKVEAAEKVGDWDTLPVTFSYKETEGSDPATAEGKYWIRTSDGLVVKMEADWKNAPIPGANGAVNAKVSYLLEPPK